MSMAVAAKLEAYEKRQQEQPVVDLQNLKDTKKAKQFVKAVADGKISP